MEQEGDGDTNINWCSRNNRQRFIKETERLGNQRTSEDHPDDNIIKIGASGGVMVSKLD